MPVGMLLELMGGIQEPAFIKIIADKLKSMGVPTKEDLQSLSERVEEIARKLSGFETSKAVSDESEVDTEQ